MNKHEEQIALLPSEPDKNCAFCGKPPNGAMLRVGNNLVHATCNIRKLNEMLDPDYEGEGEPKEILHLPRSPLSL